jgi:hypothetical protein
VAQFLRKLAAAPSVKRAKEGRLIFALDATASRQPTWDRACQLQGEMFTETAGLGGLSIQLVWYRGFGKFDAGPWVNQASDLLQRMGRVYCEGGLTQIGRILNHAINETRKHRINALVFIGDCVEEDVDQLCHLAGELGVLGVPVFIFHEGGEVGAARAFKEISRLSRGVYCPFDSGSARQLRELLTAVAVYAAGGRAALENLGQQKGGLARQLTYQIK